MSACRKACSKFPLIVILGATGTGKSKLALELALKYNGEIISADSMQVYKGLDIVTNKVTRGERVQCQHHIIDYVNPLCNSYTVVNFQQDALKAIENIRREKKLPIVVGGTNYYIESLLWNILLENVKQGQEIEASAGLSPVHKQENDEETELLPVQRSETSVGDTLHGPTTPKKSKYVSNFDQYADICTKDLHKRLWDIDEDRAKRIHPNDRRKILRALEVFDQYGVPMSELLEEQHSQEGGGDIRGSLRFKNSCVIWIQCRPQELDRRLDSRVDTMLTQGLLREMTDFHKQYNVQRLEENRSENYELGIFQSIGFKEFHRFLLLSDDQKGTEMGQKLLKDGVEEMKRVTRKYAKKQKQWIVNRFLKRSGTNVPPVYAVDSTHVSNWENDVYKPAVDLVEACIRGEPPDQEPLKDEGSPSQPEHNYCDICDMTFTLAKDWTAHMKGNRHKRKLKYLQNRENRKMYEKKQESSDRMSVIESDDNKKTIDENRPGTIESGDYDDIVIESRPELIDLDANNETVNEERPGAIKSDDNNKTVNEGRPEVVELNVSNETGSEDRPVTIESEDNKNVKEDPT